MKCSLAYQRGKPGADCNGWHTLDWTITTADGQAPEKVTTELVAFDVNGIVLKTLPVNRLDSAHLNSRLDPTDWKWKSNLKKKTHEVFAPIPVLRITAQDNGETVTAYCSNIPYLDVIQPVGTVVSDEENGNSTDVVIAAPRTDASSLSFTIDGVNVLAAPGAPAPLTSCTATSPCSFPADVNGQAVTISNLIVDLAPSIDVLASNTITFSVENQACGGHVYAIDGNRLPDALKNPTSAACHVDDVFDKASSSVFGIKITAPLPGDRLPAGSTHVTGEVCSGRDITKVTLNGKAQDLSGLSCTLLDAELEAFSCTLPIDDNLGQTDLLSDLDNTKALTVGVIDAGANRLVASASDDLGNRAFKRVVFVSGDTLAPPAPLPSLQALLEQSAMDMAVQNELKAAVMPQVMNAMDTTKVDIQNAFMIGITASATQELFTQLCNAPLPALKADGTPNDPALVGLTPGQIFKKRATDALLAQSVTTPVDPVCAPTVQVKTTVASVNIGENVTCDVTFQQDKFHVTLGLPDISMHLTSYGESGEWGNDVCVGAGAQIEGSFDGSITGIKLDFDVTESQLEGNPPANPTFNAGVTTSTEGTVDADYCGIGGLLCSFVVTVFTFGQVDLLSGSFDFDFDKDFSQEVNGAKPDPVNLNQIKVNEAAVLNFGSSLEGKKDQNNKPIIDVEIDTTGIRASLPASFQMTVPPDADIDATLGAVLTPSNAIPTFAQMTQMKDVAFGLSDDVVNMLFASLTAQGALKSECTPATTVGALLDLNKDTVTNAADCDTLTVDTGKPVQDALATAGSRGLCYGVINANCDSINLNPANPNDLNTATAQGICHALQGHDCNALSLAAGPIAAATEKSLCTNTPNPNIHADQSILFCARQDLPARMLFADNAATTTAIEATLRMNDLSVSLVLDRTGGAGTPDGAISTPLEQVPGCFANGLNTTSDCNLFATCLDLSVDFAVEQAAVGNNAALGQCPSGEPGFRSIFKTLNYTEERGYICGASGATAGTDNTVIDNVQTSSVTVDLQKAAEAAAPPICGAGLNLGIFGACDNAVINSMDATPGGLADFIGLTCGLVGLN